jgi:phage baseplate assembly protein W
MLVVNQQWHDIIHDINIIMALKDFSILLEKVNSKSSKKDIGMVSGFNAYSQYIENILKTQKGELVSNMNLGSDYFSYIFSGQAQVGPLESGLAAYIESAIPVMNNVKVRLEYASDTQFQFFITYSLNNGINGQSNSSTTIEVEL